MIERIAYEALRTAQIQAFQSNDTGGAKLAAHDAESLYNQADFQYSARRSLASLSYSVGVFHPEYQRIKSVILGVA